jgi:hypothetical protein
VNNCGACNYSCVRCENCTTGACAPKPSLFLEPSTPFPQNGVGWYGTLALADLNFDGYLDAVTVTSDYYNPNMVSIFWGGDGGFGGPATFAIGDPTMQTYYIPFIALGDFNHDGLTDLAVAIENYTDGGFDDSGYYSYAEFNEIVVYFNVPGGGFVLDDGGLDSAGPFIISSGYYYSDYFVGMAPIDIDQDGLMDFVILTASSGLLGFYQIAGGFNQAAIPTGTAFSSSTYAALAVGDVDGDGHSDLVIGTQANYPSGANGVLGVMLAADGGLTTAATTSVLGSVYSNSPIVAVSPDGLINVMEDELRTYRFTASLGLTDVGDFSVNPYTYYYYYYYYYYYGPVVADFNGDGQDDLAFNTYSGIAVWLRNDGGYDAPAFFPVDSYSPYAIAAAPLNGDSRPDIAYVGYGLNGGGVLRNNSASCSP